MRRCLILKPNDFDFYFDFTLEEELSQALELPQKKAETLSELMLGLEEQPLPHGWQCHWGDNDCCFWIRDRDKALTIAGHQGFQKRENKRYGKLRLPEGWEGSITNTGQTYFINRETGTRHGESPRYTRSGGYTRDLMP